MTTVRTIWYEAHLLSDRVGRRAREACERLGPGVHERILADGDRLAQSAALVAQAFYKHAAPVWQALGADEFGRWFNLGYTLLTAEPTQRDAALAFFTVPPKVVAAVGTARLAAWCAVGRRVCALSRKLGATFFETTGALLNRTDDARLDEWVRQGVRLHGLAGWRGEFMAQAYFPAHPRCSRRWAATTLRRGRTSAPRCSGSCARASSSLACRADWPPSSPTNGAPS